MRRGRPRSRALAPRRTSARNSSCISGSSPLVGSSRISSSGSWKNARIRPTFWRLPRESCPSGRSRSARKRYAPAPRRDRPRRLPRSRASSETASRPVAMLPVAEVARQVARAGRGSRRCRAGCRGRRCGRCRRSGAAGRAACGSSSSCPAPLGPRKPNTSPSSTADRHVLDAAVAAVELGQPIGLDRGHPRMISDARMAHSRTGSSARDAIQALGRPVEARLALSGASRSEKICSSIASTPAWRRE